jgi:hypothetical protein
MNLREQVLIEWKNLSEKITNMFTSLQGQLTDTKKELTKEKS